MSETSAELVSAYRNSGKKRSGKKSIDAIRFVCFDAETTSLDPLRAGVVALGAVPVVGGDIEMDDSIELLVRQTYNSSAVTVHGITRQESLDGVEEEEAVAQLLAYFGNSVIVGHHVAFDITLIDQACKRLFDIQLHNKAIDTAELSILLARDGALPEMMDFSLDSLLRVLGIEPHDRHTAAGDAFLTALAFQRLLRVARHVGRVTLAQLMEKPA
ncbi:MAG: exonuclease domain-containing protein [Acidobacteria bacterium]|nr:exonuclease domain-containing protein [Acidobacteriota bacterium]